MNSSSQSQTHSHTTGLNKTCVTCGSTKPEERFELTHSKKRRRINICRRCRSAGKRKSISSSPYSYLSHLYSHISHKRRDTHGFTIEREDLYAIYERQDGLCAITGIAMTHIKDGKGKRKGTMANISIDRIDNDQEYDAENIQLVCFAVNIMKHTHSMKEFLRWCKLIASNN